MRPVEEGDQSRRNPRAPVTRYIWLGTPDGRQIMPISDMDTLDALPYRRTKLLYAWADWATVDVL